MHVGFNYSVVQYEDHVQVFKQGHNEQGGLICGKALKALAQINQDGRMEGKGAQMNYFKEQTKIEQARMMNQLLFEKS